MESIEFSTNSEVTEAEMPEPIEIRMLDRLETTSPSGASNS